MFPVSRLFMGTSLSHTGGIYRGGEVFLAERVLDQVRVKRSFNRQNSIIVLPINMAESHSARNEVIVLIESIKG